MRNRKKRSVEAPIVANKICCDCGGAYPVGEMVKVEKSFWCTQKYRCSNCVKKNAEKLEKALSEKLLTQRKKKRMSGDGIGGLVNKRVEREKKAQARKKKEEKEKMRQMKKHHEAWNPVI